MVLPGFIHPRPYLHLYPTCCCPEYAPPRPHQPISPPTPPMPPTLGEAAQLLLGSGSVLLQQLVQHLGLLGMVEIGGHQPLPHGSVGGHRRLSLHVQIPLQDRVVRRGRRGRRWGVLRAGGHPHVAQALRG